VRIISGHLKGKLIENPRLANTRPLRDFVKENIFNLILHSKLVNMDLENKNILDLYSGMGSFGIECISRGARKVTFIEKDKNSFKYLNQNINELNLEDKSKAINEDVSIFLEGYGGEKFDLIFLDPPYKNRDYLKIFDLIKKKNLFNQNHLLICHRELNEPEIKLDFKKTLIKKYGRSIIYFLVF